MADGFIVQNGTLIPAFIYEGERIAIEYPNGTTFEVPPHRVYLVLSRAVLESGEPCHTLNKLSPITRLPLVVLEKPTTAKGAINEYM